MLLWVKLISDTSVAHQVVFAFKQLYKISVNHFYAVCNGFNILRIRSSINSPLKIIKTVNQIQKKLLVGIIKRILLFLYHPLPVIVKVRSSSQKLIIQIGIFFC